MSIIFTKISETTKPIILSPSISKKGESITDSIYNKIKNRPFNFIHGSAGTGKSTLIREIQEKYKNYGELTSTTGIAAINLGGRTLASTLRFFDTKSLLKSHLNGRLWGILDEIRKKKSKLIIEEVSMLDAKQLDIIYDTIYELNKNDPLSNGRDFGIDLVGDLLQLPCVEGIPVVRAKCWDVFKNNSIKLEKIWRQDNPVFVQAITEIRKGNAKRGVVLLKYCGVVFKNKLDENFDGTTIITTNKAVDEFNFRCLNKINKPLIRIMPKRRGTCSPEWEKYIPIEQRFKIGAYVMILSNDIEGWTYVNGDCGHIIDFKNDTFYIKLKRNGNIVPIGRIKRLNLSISEPKKEAFTSMFIPEVDYLSGEWVIGSIDYHPIRLAFASTVHKCQGLSLDRIQIDISSNSFAYPSMCYTALSRARNPENLIIVGSESELLRKININKEMKNWI